VHVQRRGFLAGNRPPRPLSIIERLRPGPRGRSRRRGEDAGRRSRLLFYFLSKLQLAQPAMQAVDLIAVGSCAAEGRLQHGRQAGQDIGVAALPGFVTQREKVGHLRQQARLRFRIVPLVSRRMGQQRRLDMGLHRLQVPGPPQDVAREPADGLMDAVARAGRGRQPLDKAARRQ